MAGKIFWGFFTLFLLAGQLVRAQDEQRHFLYEFLAGQYTVVGRWCDSDSTYSGTVTVLADIENEIKVKKTNKEIRNSISILRTVNGQTIQATGQIENATADKVKVLRIRFTQNGQPYEGTFLIGSDLDNYARLSGYIYLKNATTKRPGLEAWFITPKSLFLK